jgi:hypothetical protein
VNCELYHRFFLVAAGPVWDAFVAIREKRIYAQRVVVKFMKSVGAIECYGNAPANYSFDFKDAMKVDKNLWSKTKPRRGNYYYRPNKKTIEGKALAERIKALPECPSINDALNVVDLWGGFPVLISQERGYSPHICYYNMDAHHLVQVPWRDVPDKEMAKYKRDHIKGLHSSAELDYLQWEPTKEMKPIEEWEALKIKSDSVNKANQEK